MHTDARITLYGAHAIGVALMGLGVATRPVVAHTGAGILGAGLVLALVIDAHLTPPQ